MHDEIGVRQTASVRRRVDAFGVELDFLEERAIGKLDEHGYSCSSLFLGRLFPVRVKIVESCYLECRRRNGDQGRGTPVAARRDSPRHHAGGAHQGDLDLLVRVGGRNEHITTTCVGLCATQDCFAKPDDDPLAHDGVVDAGRPFLVVVVVGESDTNVRGLGDNVRFFRFLVNGHTLGFGNRPVGCRRAGAQLDIGTASRGTVGATILHAEVVSKRPDEHVGA